MTKKKRKVICLSIIVIASLAISAFLINWYLTFRLEKYLKKELSNIVAKVTDGFYILGYSDLNIDFFSGELLIKDIILHPDSAVFLQLTAKDSLPDVYLDLSLESIYFKGVNLTWRRDYKKLHFELFEIKNSRVDLFDTRLVGGVQPKGGEKGTSQNLFELIQPYISVLTAKKMNLEDATFSYSTTDIADPKTYAIRNINFWLHGFVLDENSSKLGKLLYSNNFEFVADKPQLLLSSNQVELETQNILFSTKDSLVLIEGVQLHPRNIGATDSMGMQDNYVTAVLEKIKLDGIHFKRKNSQSYLEARSFNIISSNIEYYDAMNRVEHTSVIKKGDSPDSLLASWSLYGLIYPLLHKVSIDKIRIESTRFKYTDNSRGQNNVYTMGHFSVEADRFNVDSLSGTFHKRLYSDNVVIQASNVNSLMHSQNHIANIGSLYFAMSAGNFKFYDISLKPLDETSKSDYVSGTISSVDIMGMKYNNAIEIDVLHINNPNLEYNRVSTERTKREKGDHKKQRNSFSALLKHLLIRKINLSDAYILYKDQQAENVYRLNGLYFEANNLLLNDAKSRNMHAFLASLDFNLQFKDFDNYVQYKQYRLKIGEASFKNNVGALFIRDMKLTPQSKTWTKAPDTYFDISMPLLDVSGLRYEKVNGNIEFEADSFQMPKTKIRIVVQNNSVKPNHGVKSHSLPLINLNAFRVEDIDIEYINVPKKDSVFLALGNLYTDGVRSRANGVIMTDKLSVSDANIKIKQPNQFAKILASQFNMDGVQWNTDPSESSFSLNNFDIQDSDIVIRKSGNSTQQADEKKDIYSLLGGFAKQIDLGQVNISNAKLDYSLVANDTIVEKQKLDETNLLLTNFSINTDKKIESLDDIWFNTKNLEFPIANGFYTLKIGEVDLNKKDSSLKLDRLNLTSTYPKMEFAYRHPDHQDWFDVSVGHVGVRGVDISTYLSERVLNIKDIEVNDVLLENFKNQQIDRGHNLVPMIYEGLHKLPIKLNVDNITANNIGVIYEELTKTATIPGKLFFTEMNGHFTGFTNVVTTDEQYINLDADGKLMGKGYFTANWKIPVDSMHDRFLLNAHLTNFDLAELDQIITPMFPAKVSSGAIRDLTFDISATSLGADIDMTMLYNDLRVDLFKNKNGELVDNRFLSRMVNRVLKTNNPNKPGKKPRQSSLYVTRDPYHSTFNYLWQILRPPVIESVGISNKKQGLAEGLSNFARGLKNFFSFGKKKKKNKEKEGDE